MSEGFVAGGSGTSGNDNAAFFNHQPPPMVELPPTTEEHFVTDPIPPPPSPPREPPRARFPGDVADLEKRISAPQNHSLNSSDQNGSHDSYKAHRGVWGSIRAFWAELKNDFGAAEPHQEITSLIGDTGIDVNYLRKITTHHQHSGLHSLVGSSLFMASQGFSKNNSNSSPATGTTTGTTTPSRKRMTVGVDPKEVSKAIHNLKAKIANQKESREAKYVQLKSDIAHRRNLVLLLTYALMVYGAPSHRIEEYILALMQVCGLDGRVNYTVGCTEICFINPPDPEDPMTRSAYTTLVKAQGLDIGALEIAFHIYKDVVHGEVSIEEGSAKLLTLIESPPYHKPWLLVPFYGLASAFACIWAYNGWWSDMAIAFFLGCIVGFLQIIVSSRNPLYANVLEVTAALITSFGARAFATIGGPDQKYFCFAAIAESSITTILPGYIVLCGALELQAKAVTAGSTRLFYAVIYSLLLGYGIDVGSQLWLVIDSNAPTSATCPRSVDPKWKILLVPCYLVLQAVLIRSRPRQILVQVLFGSAAYTVNYFVSKYSTAQVADTASAFTLGVLGHLYARSRHAFAFASVVAGIMVLVPSGLSAQGGLVSGISTPLFNNGTTTAQSVYEQNIYQSFSVGAQMIQVAIGLSVGLYVSAMFIYPLGRKNNALFSF